MSACKSEEYPVYWARVKKKIRPVVCLTRGYRKCNVLFISSTVKTDTKIKFTSKSTQKEYEGWLHHSIEKIAKNDLLRFIGMVEIKNASL